MLAAELMKGKLIGKVIDFDLGTCTLDGTIDWRWW